MDYIALSEALGIEKDKATYVYKRLNGGYYISMYYSKPPILFSLRDWPLLYLKKKYFPKFSQPGYVEEFQLLVTLDIYSILGSSYFLIKNDYNIPQELITKELEGVYYAIEQVAKQESIYPYPTIVDEKINVDLTPFIKDIIERRLRDNKEDIAKLFQNIAFNSTVMEELRKKYPWAKTINETNTLKAIALSDKFEDFIKEYSNYIFYLAAEKTFLFDKIVIEQGIRDAINYVEKSEIKENPSTDYEQEILNIFNIIRKEANYID
jgi:hypothetical protein